MVALEKEKDWDKDPKDPKDRTGNTTVVRTKVHWMPRKQKRPAITVVVVVIKTVMAVVVAVMAADVISEEAVSELASESAVASEEDMEDTEEDTEADTAVVRSSIAARARCRLPTSCRSMVTAASAATPPTTTTTASRAARLPLDGKLAALIRTTLSASSCVPATMGAGKDIGVSAKRAPPTAKTRATATRAPTRSSWSTNAKKNTGSASAASPRRSATATVAATAGTESHPDYSFFLHLHLLL